MIEYNVRPFGDRLIVAGQADMRHEELHEVATLLFINGVNEPSFLARDGNLAAIRQVAGEDAGQHYFAWRPIVDELHAQIETAGKVAAVADIGDFAVRKSGLSVPNSECQEPIDNDSLPDAGFIFLDRQQLRALGDPQNRERFPGDLSRLAATFLIMRMPRPSPRGPNKPKGSRNLGNAPMYTYVSTQDLAA